MSESGEEEERPKTPQELLIEDDNLEEDSREKQQRPRHRNHHHHKRSVGHRDRDIQRPRGGCYSSAPDEEKRAKLFAELIAERETLDARRSPHLYRLIQTEISRVAISPEAEHSQEVDLYNDYPITLNVRCFPPTKLQPNFNYAGRIIGPKGAYLRALMQETRSKIVVLGHGVMKDKGKETELLKTGDPKYMHLTEEMHFSVTVDGPAIEAYDRMSNAISCLKKQLLSDSRDLLDLPWILRVVQNGAAPPKGVKFIRRSITRDRDRCFRQRESSPAYSPKRRHFAPSRRLQQGRLRRCIDSSDFMRQHYANEKSFVVRRHGRNYAPPEYEGSASPRSDRGCSPPPRRRRNPPAPPATGDNYRDSSVGSRKLSAVSRSRRSLSPGYAAAEATSSYYSETNSQERDTWTAREKEDRIRDQKNPRYVPNRKDLF